MTLGYAIVQTANNAAVMAGAAEHRRGLVSGMLNLSRNLGLVSGAAAMGAVFAVAGLRATFLLATALIAGAIALAAGGIRHAAAAPAPQSSG
jgi:hypothetical protein